VPEILLTLPNLLEQDENDAGMKKIRSLVHSSRAGQKMLQQKSKQSRQADTVQNNQVQAANKFLLVNVEDLNLSKENKYPAMSINQLLKVLVDPNLRDHHKVCLDGIRYLVRNQPDCMPFMPMLIPPLMHLMK